MSRRAPHIELTAEERMSLESVVRSPSAAQRDVLRARIVLLAAEGQRNEQIQQRLEVSKPVVIKWRRRFAADRVVGLGDQPGRGRKRKYDAATRHRIAATACSTPPESVGTHWSIRTLARHLGVGVAVVQSVLAAESIQPLRFRYWKDSPDPDFEPKMLTVVGLYLQPPQNAVVLSVDEKTSMQALDRTQPRLPMKPHRIERLSHEYKRHERPRCWPLSKSTAEGFMLNLSDVTTARPLSVSCAGCSLPIRVKNFTSSRTTVPPTGARRPSPGSRNRNGFTSLSLRPMPVGLIKSRFGSVF
jgi:transposase